MKRPCVVCKESMRSGAVLCTECAVHYDREAHVTSAEVIEWAARRARRFERKRGKAAGRRLMAHMASLRGPDGPLRNR